MNEARVRELIAELDQLVPEGNAHVILYDDGDSQGLLPFCATRDGFLRVGLAFMVAAFAPGSGKGANGGEKVLLDLNPFYKGDSNVEFDCERVPAIPEIGDRRRPREIPSVVGFPILGFLVLSLLVGIYHVARFVWSRF